MKPANKDLVFPGTKDSSKPIDVTSVWWTALAGAAISDFKFHDLRHSAASYLVMPGAPPSGISKVLSYRTLQMVKRYSHLSESHTTGIIGKMNDRIFQ